MAVPILRKNGTKGYATLRGFGPKGVAVRPEFKLVAGRMFVPGKREMIVGVGAQGQYRHTAIGDKVIMPDGEWPIVGSLHTRRHPGRRVSGRQRHADGGDPQIHLQFRAGAADVLRCRWPR